MSCDYTSRPYRREWARFRDECARNHVACSICGQRIDYNLRRPHPDAFELHHVKPTSTHPHLFTVRANFSASHGRCNKRLGNKTQQAWVRPAW